MKRAGLRLIEGAGESTDTKDVRVDVTIQTQDGGKRTYTLWLAAETTAQLAHIRRLVGSGVELAATLLDAEFEREDSES